MPTRYRGPQTEASWYGRRNVTLEQILPLLIPLLILQLALVGVGLHDLTRPDRRVRGGNKLVWGLVIVFGELLGPLIYFLFGREDA
jgi:Phospholipase_D-nuclease N-terminal